MENKSKAKELKDDFWKSKELKIITGNIVDETQEDVPESAGPTLKPNVTDLREWDIKLLERYEPFYAPFCDMCCLCTYGKCDLTEGKKGACGIDIEAQQARTVLLACCIGSAAHSGHARHLLEYLIDKHGKELPIDLGINIDIEAPIMRVVLGKHPKNLGDLKEALNYLEEQMVHLLSACHTGQEGKSVDFESKALHAGLMDNLGKEIGDLAQIVALNMPKGEDAPLVELGMGSIEKEKPIVLCIGHNVAPGAGILDYMEDQELEDDVEVCGICCAALDITRYNSRAKVIGPMSKQLKFVRSGVADVVVVDEQCVRTDILEEARKNRACVIATTDKICLGLPDMTHEDPDIIVQKLVKDEVEGVLIQDPDKVGEVATRVALKISKERKSIKKLPNLEEIQEMAKECTRCGWCIRVCPNSLNMKEAVEGAMEGNFTKFQELYENDVCYTCGRCEQECEVDLPLISMLTRVGEHYVKNEKYNVRAGRGPVQDVEIRRVGAPLVLGDIPGVIAFVGCSNYPEGADDVAKMAEEFLERNYIVVASGCGAMSIGEYRDEEGKTLYERYSGDFDAKGLVNVGSCVSNAHIPGACIKIANIFAKKPLEGNFQEIADYILNRVGACGVAWGAFSQKAVAIATGVNRWGIPVVVGPHGTKYRRLFLGRADKTEKWRVNDLRAGKVMDGEPAPEHLLYAGENREEATVAIVKLCIRPTDTTKGRQIKLTNYIDLHKKYFGTIPDDVHKFVRTEKDIPITYKKDVLKILEDVEWEPRAILQEPSLMDFKDETVSGGK